MKSALSASIFAALAFSGSVHAQFADWQHSGSLYILTTPEGADLPASASLQDFPLLVRLDADWFDFGQANAHGEDVRFTSGAGEALAYQVEDWDAAGGSASIWVRIPEIQGAASQEIRMHWGQPGAASASSGAAVFNASNGYLSVWHLGAEVSDVVGTLDSEDKGTSVTKGMIGKARHFPGGKGIFCGTEIMSYPSGPQSVHTSQAWLRPAVANGRVLSWGNEKAQGKVQMWYRSPPKVHMDCYFSDADVTGEISPSGSEWIHAVHTYSKGESLLYLNGVLAAKGNPRAKSLAVERPARLWIGGWYNRYDFVGDIDEVRISQVQRSADWVRLEYENQKSLQTLVGPLVRSGAAFSLSKDVVRMKEGGRTTVTAKAGGAQKVYWILQKGDQEAVLAVDRFTCTVDAGRVAGDQTWTLQFKAVYAEGSRTLDCPVHIAEAVSDPLFTLKAPSDWDGRETIAIVPRLSNASELRVQGVAELDYQWSVSGLATIHSATPTSLVLTRAQNSGPLQVQLSLSNGGAGIASTATVQVQEPAHDAWVQRVPGADEQPLEGQFYARDDKDEGTLFYNGTLSGSADSAFLNVYAHGKLLERKQQRLGEGGSYAFTVKLAPGLIEYSVEFGSRTGKKDTVLRKVGDLVCGDAYIIAGQSNALATDTREDSPRATHDWIRSYARTRHYREGESQNLWCKPVWKAQKEHTAELGWWGMELAKQLVESQQVPIFILNGAAGGTRIDQHQRNAADPTALDTIYGRLLWRISEARLTHGIRGILWHQGESDQGAAGPSGKYGWETYQDYFIAMTAAWKQDYPNLQHYYLFQIWPNACSMGNGNGDMLREVQRTLPRLYAKMDIMSTLGIDPPGGCHYPLVGWTEFARMIQPLIEEDFYGRPRVGYVTPPDLRRAAWSSPTKTAITLEFDQPVVWSGALLEHFFLDGERGQFASGSVAGNVLTLTLKAPSEAVKITYLEERSWNRQQLLRGQDGIAALTFCNVTISAFAQDR